MKLMKTMRRGAPRKIGGRADPPTVLASNPNVYVAGDVAGGYQFTNVAEHHAGIVLRQAIFKLKWAKPSGVADAKPGELPMGRLKRP